MRQVPGATALKRQLARQQRRNATPAERRLREALARRQVLGARFRFIHPLAGFLLDFYCPAFRVCVEVDGGVHEDQVEEDAARTAALEALGVLVLRVSNDDVVARLDEVLARIATALLTRSPRRR